MLGVMVWACGCAVRYKAIGESGFIPEKRLKSSVPAVRLSPKSWVRNIFEEIAGEWRAVRKMTSVDR
jgi:hypothetical protein